MDTYVKDFERYIKKENIRISDKLSDVVSNAKIEIRKGDRIKVKNAYGNTIGPFEVLGFEAPNSYGGCIYLDWDCYWYPKPIFSVVSVEPRKKN